MSKSQAYYYFADKADLFVTACAACYEDYYAEVSALGEPSNAEEFWQFVLELCRVGVRFQRGNPIAARLSRAMAESPLRGELGRAGAQRAESTIERHSEWVLLGQRLGAVRSDLPDDLLVSLSIGVSADLDVWFAERADRATDAELEQVASKFADISWRMFSPTGLARPSSLVAPPALASSAKPRKQPLKPTKRTKSRSNSSKEGSKP